MPLRYSRLLQPAALCLATAMTCALAAPAAAQPAGPEIQVPSTFDGNQQSPAVAADATGDFVVVWQTSEPQQQIVARLFEADGTPKGDEFKVNTTDNSPGDPAVAMTSDGAFVVVWSASGDDFLEIYAQAFDAEGAVVGTEVQVNTTTADFQENPAVAIEDDGDFFVVWTTHAVPPSDIAGRHFSGGAWGSEFIVHEDTDGFQNYAAVAARPDGGYVVVWEDDTARTVSARRFDDTGAPVAAEFVVHTVGGTGPIRPSVSMNASGAFVAVWQDLTISAIQAQRSNASGTAIEGDVIRVSTSDAGHHERPVVGLAADGSFVAAWNAGSNDVPVLEDVFARRFDADDNALDADDLPVNTHTDSFQRFPSLALQSGGGFVIVWSSEGQDLDTDGVTTSNGVYAQLFDADGSPLPVELSSFTATRDGEAVVLRWTTASETNNAGFEVEYAAVETRRGASLPWQRLAFVGGRGTTAEAQTYTYRAEGLAPGRHTFRLKQVDYDGGFAYSPEVEVTVELVEAYQLTAPYPNPFGAAQAAFTLAVQRAQAVRVEVFDVQGRRVAVLHDGPMAAGATQRFEVDGSGLASGVYVVRATGEAFVATRRVLLVK